MSSTASWAAGTVAVASAADHPADEAPEAHFTGQVRVSTPVDTPPPAHLFGGTVAFAPGAHTAWHTHPLGQTLIVTEGQGWVLEQGRPAQAVRTGDVFWIPSAVKQWHGATATAAMTHVALVEQRDGNTVTWLEKVSNEEYPYGE